MLCFLGLASANLDSLKSRLFSVNYPQHYVTHLLNTYLAASLGCHQSAYAQICI